MEDTRLDKMEDTFTPRNYQIELMKIAVENNTIIFLPTGSGKTFIAVMVLKHLSAPLLRSYGDGGKITFILVNSIPLVDQHAKYVRDHTTFKVGSYSGEMRVDGWCKARWEEQFNKNQVIVMTSQILLNLVTNNFIDLEKVNLLIFDECHRGVENHCMRQIMKFMKNINQQPRILGLTATLLNSNCKIPRIMEEVRKLEVTFQSKVATVEGLDAVVGYSTNPQEFFEICQSPKSSKSKEKVISELRKTVENLRTFKIRNPHDNTHELPPKVDALKPKDILKDLINLLEDLIIHIEIFGLFGGHIACVSYMIQIERIKNHCSHNQLFNQLNNAKITIEKAKLFLENCMKGYEPKDKLMLFSSDKVLKLFKIFEEYNNKSKQELCCIVFTKRRFTAKIIHHVIQKFKEIDPNFSHLKSNFIVGNRNDPYKDTRESLYISKKNREVLNSFMNKEINVLVSSSVLEEGVDIPKCSLVVRFDKSEEYRSYIQSKGRARHNKSWYYTILEEKEQIEIKAKYENFQKIESLLNDYLVGKNLEREPPSEAAINEMYNEDKLEPYFVNGPNSAQVSMNSSISLLHRYCSSFQTDQYLSYFPEWYLQKHPDNGTVQVVIYLPILSPILDPITGPFMGNKKNAKKAAALLACKKLHLCGELDDNLLPKKQLNDADVSYLFEHWPEKKECESGTKKMKRFYNKEISSCLKEQIQAEQILYLHVLNLNPQYTRSEDYGNAICYDLYKSSLKYGLLSPQPLPDLCKFPLFDSNGTIEVEIKTNVKARTFTKDELTEMKKFHFFIFNDLLKILQNFLVFDNSGLNSEMLLVVPIQQHKDVEVDFEVIRKNKLKNKSKPAERTNLQVTEENYLGKVISPWYRREPPMYLVTRICTEKDALSPFPNSDYSNFVEYYNKKHSQTILNPSQPLLQVKRLSKKLNTFKPAGNKSKNNKTFEEYLIPELVVKEEFPPCLQLQARFLPCFLQRITYLLQLQELQVKIARDIGVNEMYLKNCPSLQLDEHLLNYEPKNSSRASQSESTSPFSDDCILLECPKNLMQIHYNKDLATRTLEAEYYWLNIEEPVDIERELDATDKDVENYESFVSDVPSVENRLVKNDNLLNDPNQPAVTYDEGYQKKHLTVLDIKFNNQTPNLCHFYQAMTTAEANDVVNLERLETLGDSFLKLISSLYIFVKFPRFNEGQATLLKSKLVSNENLFYLANIKNFGGTLKNFDQSIKSEWVPPCFCVPPAIVTITQNKKFSKTLLVRISSLISIEEQISGILTKETLYKIKSKVVFLDTESLQSSTCHLFNQQCISDKSLADCVEALLGAYLSSGGFESAIKFSEWIGIFPTSECVKNLIDTTQVDPIVNQNFKGKNVDDYIPQWQQIEKILGYQFKNRAFLLQALTHPSYSPNRLTQSYQRLEFLGDAILDFLITCYIYEHCGVLNPGQLTDLRSALVNNNTFASHVVRCGFHKFLLMINSTLQGQIDKFADYLRVKNYEIDDEVLILLEEKEISTAEYVDVPKVLGDIFEALAGAVYLDSNKDLETVWRVFYRLMWREIDAFGKNVPKNVIRRLYEHDTAYPQFSKAINVENEKTMVHLDFMCDSKKKRVYGYGTNKKMAKRAAAKIALRALKA